MDNEILNSIDQPQGSQSSPLIEIIQTVVVFLAILMIVFLFIAQPHKVQGPSMYPTFHDGDYIITDKLTYRFSLPKRGDVVVFENPRNHSDDFIKRIMGLPGDRIKVVSGHFYINDKLTIEPYLQPSVQTDGRFFLQEGVEKAVDAGNYFVLGDNRQYSSDSREWGFVKKSEILGRVIVRYWPPDAAGILPGSYTFTQNF
jgi:signal peptidase I